jgi:hypothetical protein
VEDWAAVRFCSTSVFASFNLSILNLRFCSMRSFFDSLRFFSAGFYCGVASAAAGGAFLWDLMGLGVSLVTNYFIVE